MTAHVVIAARAGGRGKSRCAPLLDVGEREQLIGLMLEDMLAALAGAPEARPCWVVTPTPALGAIAERWSARPILQPEPADLNGAFRLALEQIAHAAPRALVALLPGDLPAIRLQELDAAFALSRGCDVVLAPASDGGTGALVLRAGDDLPPMFGPGSRARHEALARARGRSLGLIAAPSLALDIDGPDDLQALLRAAPATRTAAFARRLARLETSI